jgi:hypothetical protein
MKIDSFEKQFFHKVVIFTFMKRFSQYLRVTFILKHHYRSNLIIPHKRTTNCNTQLSYLNQEPDDADNAHLLQRGTTIMSYQKKISASIKKMPASFFLSHKLVNAKHERELNGFKGNSPAELCSMEVPTRVYPRAQSMGELGFSVLERD